MYINDNVINYDSAIKDTKDFGFFKKRKTVYYNHVDFDATKSNSYQLYDSYLITLHMNKIEIMD